MINSNGSYLVSKIGILKKMFDYPFKIKIKILSYEGKISLNYMARK